MLNELEKAGKVASELFELADGLEKVFTAQGHEPYLGKIFGKRVSELASELLTLNDASHTKKDDTSRHRPIIPTC